MLERIKIVVVVTTFNGAKHIDGQLESILAQSHLPDEIFVFDDCSTDQTIEILHTYVEKNVIKLIQSDSNKGVRKNIRDALTYVGDKFDYIALSDQDDIWEKDKLEKNLTAIQSIEEIDKPALVHSDLSVIDSENNVISRSFWRDRNTDRYNHCFETLLFNNFVTGCSIMMNKAMLPYAKSIPINTKSYHDFWLALSAYSFGNVHEIKESLIRHRQHSGSQTLSGANIRITLYYRFIYQLEYFLSPGKYLEDQLEIIEVFYKRYAHSMTPDNQLILTKFLALKGKGYITKKTYIRSIFKNNLAKATLTIPYRDEKQKNNFRL
jgi:glycosyltransferase involved in cell wall biosynthesis